MKTFDVKPPDKNFKVRMECMKKQKLEDMENYPLLVSLADICIDNLIAAKKNKILNPDGRNQI